MTKTVLLGPVVSSCKHGFGEPQADKQVCLRDSLNILKKQDVHMDGYFLIVEWCEIKL